MEFFKRLHPVLKYKAVLFIIAAFILLGITTLIWLPSKRFSVIRFNETSGMPNSLPFQANEASTPNSLTGEMCPNSQRRPIAVMLASDTAARPLSGIYEADIVIEMPVITGGMTRLMAVYQCGAPKAIGSVRSARHDFISLAKAFDAVFFHWGGSHFALDELTKGSIDNIDALANIYKTFYRVSRLPAPHNGFTSTEMAWRAIERAGYRKISKFPGYKRINNESTPDASPRAGTLSIGYPGSLAVQYKYNALSRTYTRYRGGKPEMDYLNKKTVETPNVIVLRARSRQIEGQYNDVDIEESGEAVVYHSGKSFPGIWVREDSDVPIIRILDNSGKEIPLRRGKIWFEIVEAYQDVSWEVND